MGNCGIQMAHFIIRREVYVALKRQLLDKGREVSLGK